MKINRLSKPLGENSLRGLRLVKSPTIASGNVLPPAISTNSYAIPLPINLTNRRYNSVSMGSMYPIDWHPKLVPSTLFNSSWWDLFRWQRITSGMSSRNVGEFSFVHIASVVSVCWSSSAIKLAAVIDAIWESSFACLTNMS